MQRKGDKERAMADSQLRKGVLELVVLSSLKREPTYGGALLDRLDEQGLAVSSGTLYPLLTRLKKAGHIDSEWAESPSGPPRKVYSVTKKGTAHLRALHDDWRSLIEVVGQELER